MSFASVLCVVLLIAIAVVDARTGRIPDFLSVSLLLFACLHGFISGSSFLFPMLLGGGFFAVQWLVSGGRWVGSGDILLAAGIGAFVGSVSLLFIALGTAYAFGSVAAVLLLVRGGRAMTDRMAFGPYLVAGALISFYCGEWILRFL